MIISGQKNINKYKNIKNVLIEYIIKNFFIKMKNYIDSGDMVFTGSMIHSKLNIINDNVVNDIDISIINNTIGDNILEELKTLFININLDYFEGVLNDIVDDGFVLIKEVYMNEYRPILIIKDLLYIDIFRNEHPKDNMIDVELYPSIYTKYLGHDWVLGTTYNGYLYGIQYNVDQLKLDKMIDILKKIINVMDIDNSTNERSIEIYNIIKNL